MAFQTVTSVQADNSAADANGRQRISATLTVFDSKQLYDNLPQLFDDAEVSGGGTSSTYSGDEKASTLSVSASTAGLRARQSKARFVYQAGRSQQIKFTRIMGDPVAGITRRAGYFDVNDGLFFESGVSDVSVVIRSSTSGSPVDTKVAQSAWNVDKFDGSGPSGITLDWTKIHEFVINFGWLGAGTVRFGFIINGRFNIAHQVDNTNNLTTVFMANPNLPIRTDIENSGAGVAADIVDVASSVVTEGANDEGYGILGLASSFGRGASSIVISSNTDYTPLLSFRLRSDRLSTTVVARRLSILVTTNESHEWRLYLNPTVAGVDAAVWNNVSAVSGLEFDIARTTANTVSGGRVVDGGWNADSADVLSALITDHLPLGSNLDGSRDEIVLAVRNVTAGNETYNATMNVEEIF